MYKQQPLTDNFKSLQPAVVPVGTQRFNKLVSKFWDRLTAPMEFVPSSDHRRARLVSATLVIFTCLAVLITLVIPLLSGAELRIVYLVSDLIYVALYFLSRTKYYKLSTVLIMIVVNLVIWYSAVALIKTSDVLEFIALVAILAGILLSTRATVILILINFVALIAGSAIQSKFIINPVLKFPLAIDFFIAYFGLFLILIRYRDLLEKDRIAEALKAEGQRRATEELRTLDQVKNRFLASMSHELRTPLNSVLNFTEFVLNGVFGPVNEEQADALRNVVSSGDFLLGLINDVLDMTKIESGALELFIEQVDLQEVIKASLDTARGLLRDKPVTLVERISPDLPSILGDKRRIQQILNNLISNAIKFTVQGSVTLEAACEGETSIRLSVRDTGAGIAPADREMIFQPFRQTKQGVQQGSGTGLGLPISRSLTEAHGGKLTLESKPGEGSAFHVILPLKARETVVA